MVVGGEVTGGIGRRRITGELERLAPATAEVDIAQRAALARFW
jgi:hypothetical protein